MVVLAGDVDGEEGTEDELDGEDGEDGFDDGAGVLEEDGAVVEEISDIIDQFCQAAAAPFGGSAGLGSFVTLSSS